MGVRSVYSSPGEVLASVIGYVHDDGTTAVVLSPAAARSPGLTLNIHLTPGEAREIAAMLVTAADATEHAPVDFADGRIR